MTDMLGAHIQVGFTSVLTVLQHHKSGALRVLGVGGKTRSSSMPDIPTVVEAGLPGYETSAWYGLYGPARMGRPLVNRLYEATRDAVHHSEARNAYAQFSIEPVDMSPEAFARFLTEDLVKYEKIVRAAGIERQ